MKLLGRIIFHSDWPLTPPSGPKVRLPWCRQPGHGLRRGRQGLDHQTISNQKFLFYKSKMKSHPQGLDWLDRHDHRLPVDVVGHPPPELNSCQQGTYQSVLLGFQNTFDIWYTCLPAIKVVGYNMNAIGLEKLGETTWWHNLSIDSTGIVTIFSTRKKLFVAQEHQN